ncbi:MAG TPA: hypothetical protein VKR55_29180 [Bradyrhizobium sp.]|uniref:glycoside hydrolase family 113 n=1 Tax=Bradyrhizobium sp. TaxID=376 RepID=UPI002CFE3813|nr:hypothetical protein [Bradyrhizobium sp.]HLZ06211.1 hypothetical protein [Bradyrhizobium sp.]
MATLFDVQGLGALSEWNGQFSSPSAFQAFQTIAALGSNSVELTVRIWTQTGTSNTVIADPDKTESDASLLASFKAAEADGLSVVFKPNLSPLDGSPGYALAPTDVAAFFASYKAEIVHLATIAQEGGVTTFAIGNEMQSLSGAQYLPYWTDIINSVRQVYHGQLTYAAATDEAYKVSFWNELDTIGVNTYPPLTTAEHPTVQQLVDAWHQVPTDPYWAAVFEHQSPVDFLHSLSEQYGKPVLMTEVGYRSMDGTAIEPGAWNNNGTPDPNAQADAFKAFFQVWTTAGGSWLQGAEIWQWDLNNQYTPTGYSPMGKPAAAVIAQYFHGDGGASANFANGTVDNADGTRDVYTTGIVGESYASEHDVIGANGYTTLIERFFADGTLAFTQALNNDSSVVQAQYDTSGHLAQFAIDYANGTFDQLTFDASGNETGEIIRHVDGSRDIYVYEIAGQAYTSEHVVTDASGQSTLIDQYRTDGSLLLQQTVDASGVKTIDQYDDSGHLAEKTVVQTDGSYVQSTHAADGSLSSETLRHADGSRDIYSYNIVGQAYTSEHVVNDPSGHSILIDQYRADGSLFLEQTVAADSVKTVDQYDDSGHLAQQMVMQTDGTYVQSNFGSDGTLLSQTTRNLDGSRDVDTYGITGQSYSARHDMISATGYTLSTTFDNTDGSHTQVANAPGVTITAPAGNDVINSAGGDNFVFKEAPTQAVINNFQTGEAPGHDVIEISAALVPDPAHVAVEVVGHDTVIELGQHGSITLAGVTAPLTPHDILIV